MARGNSRAQSEARSPEIVSLRENMKSDTKAGVNAKEAIEKDPTLKAVLGNPDFIKKFEKLYDKAVESVVEEAANEPPDDNTTAVNIAPQYFKIGNNIYELSLPDIEIDLNGDEEDMQVERVSHDGFDSMMADADIRILTPDEAKKMTFGKPDLPYGLRDFNLEDSKGLDIMTRWDKSERYQYAIGVLNANSKWIGRTPEIIVDGDLEKQQKTGRGLPVQVEGSRYQTVEQAKANIERTRIAEKIVKTLEGQFGPPPKEDAWMKGVREKLKEANIIK